MTIRTTSPTSISSAHGQSWYQERLTLRAKYNELIEQGRRAKAKSILALEIKALQGRISVMEREASL
jgi:hypothetical protein